MTDGHEIEDRILREELGELGGLSGAAGGLLGGGLAGLFGGRRGGRQGAEAAAGRLRADRCELAAEFDASPADVLSAAGDVLRAAGRVLEDPPPAPGEPVVWAVVGSGAGGMNPAVVHVAVTPSGDGAGAVVRAAAKEGLIKQHGGRQAATRVRDALAAAVAA